MYVLISSSRAETDIIVLNLFINIMSHAFQELLSTLPLHLQIYNIILYMYVSAFMWVHLKNSFAPIGNRTKQGC